MKLKNKIFILIIVIGACFILFKLIYIDFISENFITVIQVSCNPKKEVCFSDGATPPTFFKLLQTNAQDINRVCGKDMADCTITCQESFHACSYTFCNTNNTGKYGSCSTGIEATSSYQ
jgi:hypothetical protein